MKQPAVEAFPTVALVHVDGKETAVRIRMEHLTFCVVEFLEDCPRLNMRRSQTGMIARCYQAVALRSRRVLPSGHETWVGAARAFASYRNPEIGFPSMQETHG
jgi:hypothetical protein